ncbi:MAG: SAVED domain-containing protein [Coriobacteriia bacterium]|nr:SAVED domain-containing protein [Coriobacteriia bacterium]
MSNKRQISKSVECMLWGQAAGRCEVCGRELYKDSAYGLSGNYAEKAHIIAVSDNGPRRLADLRDEEINDANNLMLLCAEHHKMIDDKEDHYLVDHLLGVKADHEERVRYLMSIPRENETQMVTYFSNIDMEISHHDANLYKQAVVNDSKLPKFNEPISLGATGPQQNMDAAYINQQVVSLELAFKQKAQPVLERGVGVSLFALAPQPLLIKLGTLLSDQYDSHPYQCHRTGEKWAWKRTSREVDYRINRPHQPNTTSKNIALILSLSASISHERVTAILPKTETPIYEISIAEPNFDFVESEAIADAFIKTTRSIMDEIRNMFPLCEAILLFPAMPNSLAVRFGMNYMFTSDLPVVIFNEHNGVFEETISIGENNGE